MQRPPPPHALTVPSSRPFHPLVRRPSQLPPDRPVPWRGRPVLPCTGPPVRPVRPVLSSVPSSRPFRPLVRRLPPPRARPSHPPARQPSRPLLRPVLSCAGRSAPPLASRPVPSARRPSRSSVHQPFLSPVRRPSRSSGGGGGGGVGGSRLDNGATVAAGAAGSTRTSDRHPSLPTPLPHPFPPSLPLFPYPTTPYLLLGTAVAALAGCGPAGQCAGRPVAVHAGGPCRQGI